MKLPEDDRKKLWVMALAIEAGDLSAVELVAYAIELRRIVKDNGGIPTDYRENT
jgi:hypothetical protein